MSKTIKSNVTWNVPLSVGTTSVKCYGGGGIGMAPSVSSYGYNEKPDDCYRWYDGNPCVDVCDTYKTTWQEDYEAKVKKYITIKEGEMGHYNPSTGEVKIESNIKGDGKVGCSSKTVYEYELKVINLAAGVEKRMLLDVEGWVELASGRTLHDVVLVKHAKELAAFSKDAEHLSVKVKLIDTHTVECKEKE